MGFLIIPLTTLKDDYNDRPKLSKQKKPIWVFTSSPTKEGTHFSGGGTIYLKGFC